MNVINGKHAISIPAQIKIRSMFGIHKIMDFRDLPDGNFRVEDNDNNLNERNRKTIM